MAACYSAFCKASSDTRKFEKLSALRAWFFESLKAQMNINNQDVAVGKDGNFDVEIKLSEGTNKLVIVSTSKIGRSTRIERTVFLQP